MDKTDIILTSFLLINSRTSYRELADKLGLSINAIHKRIQLLMESGIIRKFTAKVSLSALNAVTVVIFGNSEAGSTFNLYENLGKHGSIYWVAIAGGNYLYVGAYLRNISELEPFVEYVKKQARMANPTVGIIHSDTSPPSLHRSADVTLYPLDYQIIRALHDNSRKPIADVAQELGVSAKTVRRRLSRMINNCLIELSIEWYPDASNDIITVFHIRLKPEAGKNAVGLTLKKCSPNVLFRWAFSNLPNDIMAVVWTNTMKELKDIQGSFEREETFESIVPNILYVGYVFDTWRDKL